MRNYVQPGNTVTVTAPYAVLSGAGVLVGSLFGVASTSAAETAQTEIVTEGVFDLAKVQAQAWTVGQPVYWDATAKLCTTTATDNTRIGVALAVAANPSGIGRVRLNGSF